MPQVLVGAHLAGSDAAVYTCPALKSAVIATATLCNTSASVRTVELSVVKSGGAAGDGNRVAIIELAADESCVVEEIVGLLMGPGDFISGFASTAGAVSVVLTGAVSS